MYSSLLYLYLLQLGLHCMGLLQPTLQTQQHFNINWMQSWSTFADNFSSDTECALSWHWQWQAGPARLQAVERTVMSHGQTQKFLWLHDNIWICWLLIFPELQRISRFSVAWPISTKFSRHVIINVAWHSVFRIVKDAGKPFATCSVPVSVFDICDRGYQP